MPKFTTTVPLCVSDSVLSVSSTRAVVVSTAAFPNPSSSTVRFVGVPTCGVESAASVSVTVAVEVSPSPSVIV